MKLLWALALLGMAACAGSARAPRMTEDAYPGVLVDSRALPDGLFVRQRIEARFGERSESFSAVLQTEGGVLSLLALTPYGTRAFLIEQRGQSIRYTPHVDRELPFPPRFILIDVHRALFTGGHAGPGADGQRALEQDGERVTELWRGGELYERRFERLDGEPPGSIRVSYPNGVAAGRLAERFTLENGWFGYRLEVTALPE